MIKDLNVILTKYRLKCNRANLNFLVILEHRTVFKELTRRDFRFATVSWSCSIIALNHFLTCSLCLSLSLSLHFCPCVNAGSGCVDEVQYHAAYVLVTYYSTTMYAENLSCYHSFPHSVKSHERDGSPF